LTHSGSVSRLLPFVCSRGKQLRVRVRAKDPLGSREEAVAFLLLSLQGEVVDSRAESSYRLPPPSRLLRFECSRVASKAQASHSPHEAGSA
jgi:hypothetical protein